MIKSHVESCQPGHQGLSVAYGEVNVFGFMAKLEFLLRLFIWICSLDADIFAQFVTENGQIYNLFSYFSVPALVQNVDLGIPSTIFWEKLNMSNLFLFKHIDLCLKFLGKLKIIILKTFQICVNNILHTEHFPTRTPDLKFMLTHE